MTGRVALVIFALAVGGVLAMAAAPPGGSVATASASASASVSASTGHRAAVVVDLGDGQVKVGCVTFSEDHISGLEALDRASMAPVAQTYGGQGSAVCALCGKGCTAGSTCLTCKAPNYWAYYHDGTYSSISASRSQVRNGDTEGWKWGKGEKPANVPFDQVCLASVGPPATSSPTTGPATPTTHLTQPPPTSPAPTTTVGVVPGPGDNLSPLPSTPATQPAGTGTGSVVPTSPATTAPSGSTTSSITPNSSGTTAPASGDPTGAEQATGSKHVIIERAGAGTRASARQSGNGGHSPLLSIVAFTAAIAAVAGLIVVFRRRRAGLE